MLPLSSSLALKKKKVLLVWELTLSDEERSRSIRCWETLFPLLCQICQFLFSFYLFLPIRSRVQSGPHLQQPVGMLGLIPGKSLGSKGGGGVGGRRRVGFSFQVHGRWRGVFAPALLVGVLCKSVGVLLAEVRAVGAGPLCRGPAEGVAAASPAGADRGLLSGEDRTWLPVRGPVLSVLGGTWVGCPGGCGCCSPEWSMSPVETCGLEACWVGWVPTGDLNGTRIGAVGRTGRSVQD